MKRYCLIFAYMVAFLFQSCDNIDIPEKEYVEKRISVSFDGNTEKVYPWVSFSAYTENHETLYIVQDNDTAICQDGTYSFNRGEIPTSGQIVVYAKSRDLGYICVGVTYRKRMDSPSNSDDLKVRIKGYVNNVQYLDTMYIMHAFKLKENINESDYIYKLKF